MQALLIIISAAPVDPNLAVVDDNLLDLMWSITVAIFVLFGMIGAFVSGKVADHFGRYVFAVIIICPCWCYSRYKLKF